MWILQFRLTFADLGLEFLDLLNGFWRDPAIFFWKYEISITVRFTPAVGSSMPVGGIFRDGQKMEMSITKGILSPFPGAGLLFTGE